MVWSTVKNEIRTVVYLEDLEVMTIDRQVTNQHCSCTYAALAPFVAGIRADDGNAHSNVASQGLRSPEASFLGKLLSTMTAELWIHLSPVNCCYVGRSVSTSHPPPWLTPRGSHLHLSMAH